MSEAAVKLEKIWQNEDERQHLVAENLGTVQVIARRIHRNLPRHVALEDLIHAGVLGLIDAVQKFDPDKQVQFGCYAKFRIRGAILDSLREMDWGPRELRRQSREIEEARNHLRLQLGRQPGDSELALELGIALPELHKLIHEIDSLEIGSSRVISSRDGKEADLCEAVPGEGDTSPLTEFLQSETRHLLLRAIQALPEREQRVLSLYYFNELTMRRIGRLMGIGESRVSQIHSMAVSRLRARMSELSHGTALQRRAAGAGR